VSKQLVAKHPTCCIAFGPNQRLQSTPLAASEIAPILSASFCYNVIAIFWCGAAEAQLVGRQLIASSY
jgi:hypothetical protein